MQIPIYQVDAFASGLFTGNPAAVCLLEEWLDDPHLQSIAAENNLSETAFLLKNKNEFQIRWFTPLTEVALCGHATLASAFIIFNYLAWPENVVRFQTRKSGLLSVKRNGDRLEMDFPARPPVKTNIPVNLAHALGQAPLEILNSVEDLLVVMDSEHTVKELEPDFDLLKQIEQRGIIVTAEGDRCDFVSRYFAPYVGIPEDPVTGSAHCVLIPFWAERLRKDHLYARQISRRGGELFCEDRGERVVITGAATLYLKGTITI